MPVSKETQDAVAKELRKSEPLMDIEKYKADFLLWLNQLTFPEFKTATSWEECLIVIPHGDGAQDLEEGVKVRFAITLFTLRNRYLLSVLEHYDPKSRGKYLFTIHINWDETEKRILKRIESQYSKQFDGGLKAKHTIWAQTFGEGELHEALNAGAVAILSNELTNENEKTQSGTPIQKPHYSQPIYAEKTDEENIIL